ncbi:MAG TPA: hypothetical protein VF543_17480 [Pyrinomonadaceae bacterium]|jgi:hypothetical protein
MKKYCLLLVAACLLLSSQIVGRAQREEPMARQVDSYGEITSEDVMARLDNFSIELRKMPHATGYLICYGPEGEGSGTGKYVLKVQTDYLLNTRGLEPESIRQVYGGRYYKPDEVETELWIAPPGADAPELRGYESSLETIRGKFKEYNSWDRYPDGDGPAFGNIALAGLADVLKQQPKSLAYIVSFNVQGAAPGTWRRVAKRDASALQAYGIAFDRIKIIYGGEVKTDVDGVALAIINLWVLPPDAPPPVKEGKSEQTPKEAVHLGIYNDYILKYGEEERHVFEGLLDVLRADARLNVYLIVRPRNEPLGIMMPDDQPNIDPAKLVEKWKSEMVEKYGINGNRIIVMPVDSARVNEGTIEAWAVPAGAALPNPYDSDYESLDEN